MHLLQQSVDGKILAKTNPTSSSCQLHCAGETQSPAYESSTSPSWYRSAGQAFAKHYNPLLSGETSHGSQYSSDKSPNAVPLKRLGEAQAPQPDIQSLPCPEQSSEHDSQTATSQYIAPPDQAMYALRGATTPTATAQPQKTHKPPGDKQQGLADVCSGTPQGIRVQRTADEGVTNQGIAGLGGVGQASRGLQGGADPASKQPSLGRQLGDALKLRNWKPNRPAAPSQLTDDVNSKSAMSLSPRTESAMMVAASQLGFDARLAGNCQVPAQPTLLPVSDSQAAGSVLYSVTLWCRHGLLCLMLRHIAQSFPNKALCCRLAVVSFQKQGGTWPQEICEWSDTISASASTKHITVSHIFAGLCSNMRFMSPTTWQSGSHCLLSAGHKHCPAWHHMHRRGPCPAHLPCQLLQ